MHDNAFSQTYVNVNISQPDQLVADAGEDMSISAGEAVQIGGDPSASGGNGGYNYIWLTPAPIDDTTISNPNADPISDATYVLIVTDSLQCTAKDTIIISIITEPIDTTGNSDTTDTSGTNINDLRHYGSIEIYPNPASNQIKIRINNITIEGISVALISSSGKYIYQEDNIFENEFILPVNLSLLEKGIYFVQFIYEHKTVTKKLIIN